MTAAQQRVHQKLKKGWVLKVDQSNQIVWLFKFRRIPIRISKRVFQSLLTKQLLRRVPSNRIDVTWYSNIV